MCLIVFAFQSHPSFPLILAANRDEFYQRPTQKAHLWDQNPAVIAGKDLEAGGTWMGISKTGRFAALTNYRNLKEGKVKRFEPNPPSRGKLVSEFLSSAGDTEGDLQNLQSSSRLYRGFNLIAGTIRSMFYFSNQTNRYTRIKPGIHSVSNAFLDTPWPKTVAASAQFEQVLKKNSVSESNPEPFFKLLEDDTIFPDEQLPSTGLSLEMERAVSPIFISTEDYGTRCSTVLLVDRSGQAFFHERTYFPLSDETKAAETASYSIDTGVSLREARPHSP